MVDRDRKWKSAGSLATSVAAEIREQEPASTELEEALAWAMRGTFHGLFVPYCIK